MPRIDDIEVQNKIFKKKEYRSWDTNLIDKLKLVDTNVHEKVDRIEISASLAAAEVIPPIQNEKETVQNKGSIRVQNKSSTVQNKGSRVQNKSSTVQNKGSIRVQLNSNYEPLLALQNESFCIKKLIKKLGTNDQKLFFFVVNLCCARGSLTTGEVSAEDIDTILCMPRNSRETSIKRLKTKGLLGRQLGKRGPNGVIILSITELVKTEALNYLSENSSLKSESFSSDLIKVQNKSSISAYSSSNIYNNTTTEIPENWKSINFEALKHIGFSETQLRQLQQKNLNTPEIIQESINHFAYGLENNKKFKDYADPLNVLMGVLRKGQGWFEKGYISPLERAQAELIRQKGEEQGRIKKMQEEAFNLAYEAWRQNLSEKEIKELIPPNKEQAAIPQRVRLSMYFKEHVWPEIKHQYVIEA